MINWAAVALCSVDPFFFWNNGSTHRLEKLRLLMRYKDHPN